MDKQETARAIAKKLRAFLGLKHDKQLAAFLEIKPSSVSGSINDGRIPPGWIKKIREKMGDIPHEILEMMAQVESATVISRKKAFVCRRCGYLLERA